MKPQKYSMRLSLLITLLVITTTQSPCEEAAPGNKAKDETVFRDPFTLKLHVDKENYYEQKFDKVPYVHENDVYLFKDDSFGIRMDIVEGIVQNIVYEADEKKADMTFKFSQKVETDGTAMMLLVIKNQSVHKFFMDALMTVPGREKIAKTTILPIDPSLSNYESWPHPIVQLVLCNFRLKKDSEPKQSPPSKSENKSSSK